MGKEKIRQTYEKKAKQVETNYAIAKSLAINRQRLEKIKAQQEVMHKISTDVQQRLVQDLKDSSKSSKFTTKLITQGLLMLLETDVTVKCRKCDVDLVKGCLAASSQEYSSIVKQSSGADKKCNPILSHEHLHPAPS